MRADPVQAIGYYRQVVAVGRQIGDDQLTAIPSAMIGQALTVQGQWAKARELLTEAVPALEKSAEWREWCRVVGYLGAATVACGDYHRGIAEAQRGLDHAVERNDLAMIGSNHILLCDDHVLNERMEAVAEAALAAIDAAIETHGGHGFAAEFGLTDLSGIVRALRAAPVSREVILNFVAEHSLGLPRAY